MQTLVILILALLLTLFAPGSRDQTDKPEQPSRPAAPVTENVERQGSPGSGTVAVPSEHQREAGGDASPATAIVVANRTILYETPEGDNVIAELNEGDTVTVLRQEGEWWYVHDPLQRLGYVRRFLLKVQPVARWTPMVLGYYLSGSQAGSEASLREYGHYLTAMAPWTWRVEPDGSLSTDFAPNATAAALASAGRLGLATHGLVHNLRGSTFDPTLAARVLSNTEARDRLIAQLLERASTWGLTGIHIDFENVPPENRDDLTSFIAQLSAAARPAGLAVSMAVPARTADDENARNAAYDYGALAQHLDFMVVMTYDQHWRNGPPGPIASIAWVEQVVDHLLAAGVPREKLVLGIAGYGYDWPPEGSDRWARAVTYRQAMATLEQARQRDPSVTLQWDDEAKMPFFTYEGRYVSFENADSLSHKLQLVRDRQLGGVALWRLGQEDPAFWPLIDHFFPERRSSPTGMPR